MVSNLNVMEAHQQGVIEITRRASVGELATGDARAKQCPVAPASTQHHTRIHHSGGGNRSFDPLL